MVAVKVAKKADHTPSALEKLMHDESKTVRGRFKNYETPGGSLPFHAKKFPNQPVYKQVFEDNKVYDVPLWVARWLNGTDGAALSLNGKIGSCSYPIHGFKWDKGKDMPNASFESGERLVPIIAEEKRVQRFGFQSLEFDAGLV